MCLTLYVSMQGDGRSQWPRGLRRGSTAARLLGLWVRIPPRAWILSVVSVVCCQVEVSATAYHSSRGVVPSVVCLECESEASIMRRPWPTGGCCAMEKKKYWGQNWR
jgi:hypothetical protein